MEVLPCQEGGLDRVKGQLEKNNMRAKRHWQNVTPVQRDHKAWKDEIQVESEGNIRETLEQRKETKQGGGMEGVTEEQGGC